jgi:tRNA A37 threonylcarbamoyltransferase TsaD
MTSLGGDRDAIALPARGGGPDGLQISFSGLKTAVLNDLRKRGFVVEAAKNAGRLITARAPESPVPQSDTRTLSVKLPLADICRQLPGGGRGHPDPGDAGRHAQGALPQRCAGGRGRGQQAPARKAGGGLQGAEATRLHAAPLNLCTDNAEMVAGLGFHKLVTGQVADLTADVLPNKDEKRMARKG